MATASHIQLSSANPFVYHVPQLSTYSASRSTDILQDNHDHHHIFFEPKNALHNHTAHHILTLYALGASDEEIQKAYNANKGKQRSPGEPKPDVAEDLQDRSLWPKHFGNIENYIDFLEFFQAEIDRKGVADTIREHVFGSDEAADGMLKRLLAGYLHPIIHIGFGLEFGQPAIVAEGLAMAACSSSWAKNLVDKVESVPAPPDKTLFSLREEILDTPALVNSVSRSQAVRVRDGILKQAPDEMAKIASQWRVRPADLERKAAEMIAFCAFQTAAAQRPEKHVQIDFVFMHCMNASIFYSLFLKLDWLTQEQKCRLVQMKGWLDLAMYVAEGSPELSVEAVKGYKPKIPGDWDSVIRRTIAYDYDDSHVCKLIRALLNGEQVCRPFEEESWPIKGESWLQCGHIVIDAVESGDPSVRGLPGIYRRWTRGSGFPECWENFPPRP